MPSLSDLYGRPLANIIRLSDLEDAANLSLTDQEMFATVTPLLRKLCDPEQLALLLPYCPQHRGPYLKTCWWGLAMIKGGTVIEAVTSSPACEGTYYTTEYEAACNPGFFLPFNSYGLCQSPGLYVEECVYDIWGPHRPTFFSTPVLKAVVTGAMKAFKKRKAVYAARSFLEKQGLKNEQPPLQTALLEEVVIDVQYCSALMILKSFLEIGDFAPQPVVQRRLDKDGWPAGLTSFSQHYRGPHCLRMAWLFVSLLQKYDNVCLDSAEEQRQAALVEMAQALFEY